jgi:hypothetical protein
MRKTYYKILDSKGDVLKIEGLYFKCSEAGLAIAGRSIGQQNVIGSNPRLAEGKFIFPYSAESLESYLRSQN